VIKVVVGLLRSVSDEVYGAHAVWGGAIILQPGDGVRTAILAKELSRCDSMVPGKGLIDFDPSSFVVFETNQKGPSEQEKKLEQSGKADDILD
jgi:hypothetical protein